MYYYRSQYTLTGAVLAMNSEMNTLNHTRLSYTPIQLDHFQTLKIIHKSNEITFPHNTETRTNLSNCNEPPAEQREVL